MTTRGTGNFKRRFAPSELTQRGRSARWLVWVAMLLCGVSPVCGVEALSLDADAVVISDAGEPAVESLPEAPLPEGDFTEPAPLGASCNSCCRSDDVWIVNTRLTENACCVPEAVDCMRYERLVNCRWRAASLEDFVSTADPSMPTVIWVHGNNSDANDARKSGWAIYQAVRKCCGGPLRFVIWSWPSERQTICAVPDVRIKADVSEAQGYYLAWFLDQVPAEMPVGVIGYSYGTRLTSAGMHLLGGGVIQRLALRERAHPDRQPMRLFFMAAAQDSNGFAPWGRYRCAPSQIAHLTVLVNECDFVLRCYPRLEAPDGPPALGATGLRGMAATSLARSQVRQVDVSGEIHICHGFRYYIRAECVQSCLSRFGCFETQWVAPGLLEAPIQISDASR